MCQNRLLTNATKILNSEAQKIRILSENIFSTYILVDLERIMRIFCKGFSDKYPLVRLPFKFIVIAKRAENVL